MPAPAPGPILYRFAPPTDSFDGTHHLSREPYAYNEHSEAGGVYTLRGWCDTYYSGYNQYPGEEYYYKQHANSGKVHRVKFTWSTTHLPWDYANRRLMLMALQFSNTLESNSESALWNFGPIITVDDHGALFTYNDRDLGSSNVLSINTDYDFEIYIRSAMQWQIWVDGDLWLEEHANALPDIMNMPYAQFAMGWQGPTNSGSPDWWPRPVFTPYDEHVHYSDIVWTIEEIAFAGWTMMAPGII